MEIKTQTIGSHGAIKQKNKIGITREMNKKNNTSQKTINYMIFTLISIMSNIVYSEQENIIIEIENNTKIISNIIPGNYNEIYITNKKNEQNIFFLPNNNITTWNNEKFTFKEKISTLKTHNGMLFWLNANYYKGYGNERNFYIAKIKDNSQEYKINYNSPKPMNTLRNIAIAENCITNVGILNKYYMASYIYGENSLYTLSNIIFYDFYIINENEILLVLSIKEDITYGKIFLKKGLEIWKYKKNEEIALNNSDIKRLNLNPVEYQGRFHNNSEWNLINKIDTIITEDFKIIDNREDIFIIDKIGNLYKIENNFNEIKNLIKLKANIDNLTIINDIDNKIVLIMNKDNFILFNNKETNIEYINNILNIKNKLNIELETIIEYKETIIKKEQEEFYKKEKEDKDRLLKEKEDKDRQNKKIKEETMQRLNPLR